LKISSDYTTLHLVPILPSRELLIFDEPHLLGTEIVRFRDLTSISFAHDVGPIGCSMPLISTQVVALQVE